MLKKILSKLPLKWQLEVKRYYHYIKIKKNDFSASEPEFDLLEKFIKPGDWAIDVGANVGHYTKKLSDLVGIDGRVLAFEPIFDTFNILASNVQWFSYQNVSLFNVAVADKTELLGMCVPLGSSGLLNYYQAHFTNDLENDTCRVLSISLDALQISHKVSIIKIDAEGHEKNVLMGMMQLIKKDLPVLIVETGSIDVKEMLSCLGYTAYKLKKSPNILFVTKEKADSFHFLKTDEVVS